MRIHGRHAYTFDTADHHAADWPDRSLGMWDRSRWPARPRSTDMRMSMCVPPMRCSSGDTSRRSRSPTGGQAGPVLVSRLVTRLPGQAGVFAGRGVEHGDRVGQRDGQVEEQGALPGLAGGLDPQLVLALGGGGSAASNWTYRSAALRPLPGGLHSGVPSEALHSPDSRS